MARTGGNPDIATAPKPGATSEIGKFKISLNAYKGSKKPRHISQRVPDNLVELYNWYKEISTKEINVLLEIQNMYKVMKEGMMDKLADKILSNETLTKKDLDHLKLIKDTLVDLHKLKYGDKKTVEHKIDMRDVRKAIFSENPKKIIEVNENGTVSQDMDRGGRGQGHAEENREDKESDGSAGKL